VAGGGKDDERRVRDRLLEPARDAERRADVELAPDQERRNCDAGQKVALVGPEMFHQFERNLMLTTLDQHWREHLASLDHLRQGIHLRGYAQKNPKQEYKREAFELFSDMLDRIKHDVVKVVLTVQVRTPQDVAAVEEAPAVSNVRYQHAGYDEALAGTADDPPVAVATRPFQRAGQKVGRNDPCPCGSGKKYKHCHGRL